MAHLPQRHTHRSRKASPGQPGALGASGTAGASRTLHVLGFSSVSHVLTFVLTYIRKEPVLFAAALCAVLSSLAIPPSPQWIGYFDAQVLILLLCLMATVSGLRRCGLLGRMAQYLTEHASSLRSILLCLVLLPFFTSMLLTNDVALLTFVPFAILTLESLGQRRLLAFTVVMQAAAANLGGMVLPTGNPQNIFIYAHYQLGFGEFVAALAPFCGASLVGCILACTVASLFAAKSETGRVIPQPKTHVDKTLLAIHGVLFALCLLCVARAISCWMLLAIVAAALVLLDRKAFAGVDWGLLATFVCFFILSGNLSSIPQVSQALSAPVTEHAFITSLAASQVMSNVPAAALLAPFTSNWHGLLLGVNIGGLGTPIASLASLIAYRLYMTSVEASSARFMIRFALVNLGGLVLLCGMYAMLL